MKHEKGSYVLVTALYGEAIITVGKLGTFPFPPGYYLYAGSALGGFSRRINRYFRKNRNWWHIDYLLKHAQILEVWCMVTEKRLECQIAQVACALAGAQVLVKGFGSSDCNCPSHLIYFLESPMLTSLQAELERLLGCQLTLTPFIMN